jgi:hypothetical protein
MGYEGVDFCLVEVWKGQTEKVDETCEEEKIGSTFAQGTQGSAGARAHTVPEW